MIAVDSRHAGALDSDAYAVVFGQIGRERFDLGAKVEAGELGRFRSRPRVEHCELRVAVPNTAEQPQHLADTTHFVARSGPGRWWRRSHGHHAGDVLELAHGERQR